MRERPIIFSGEMVRAILSNRKTQTRRVVKPPPHRCPFHVGQLLWVREKWSGLFWARHTRPAERTGAEREVWYWADGEPTAFDWERPRPSIHLPRWGSRITLEVTDMCVTRLQDIDPRDAQAEGAPELSGMPIFHEQGVQCYVSWFRGLWDSINGEKPGRAWADNPPVWALTFQRVTKEETDAK